MIMRKARYKAMTEQERQELIRQQEKLMQSRDIYERTQTEHSDDNYYQDYCQHNMNNLDMEAEYIRRELEMGCCE